MKGDRLLGKTNANAFRASFRLVKVGISQSAPDWVFTPVLGKFDPTDMR
jgi:hypothetical protein